VPDYKSFELNNKNVLSNFENFLYLLKL